MRSDQLIQDFIPSGLVNFHTLQSPKDLSGPSLNSVQFINVFPVLGDIKNWMQYFSPVSVE